MAGIMASAMGSTGGVAYIGLKGNDHVGWMKICNRFGKYCRHIGSSAALSLLASVILVLLVAVSSYSMYRRSRWSDAALGFRSSVNCMRVDSLWLLVVCLVCKCLLLKFSLFSIWFVAKNCLSPSWPNLVNLFVFFPHVTCSLVLNRFACICPSQIWANFQSSNKLATCTWKITDMLGVWLRSHLLHWLSLNARETSANFEKSE